MTRIELHEELSTFADLVADLLSQKLAAILPGSFENFKQQRDFASLQARAKAQAELGKMIEAASIREAEALKAAEQKQRERAELERTIDRSLLTPQELDHFLAGGLEPSDYRERVVLKRQRQEEAELMVVYAELLTDDEFQVYSERQELPADYRDRALKARDKRRQQKRFGLVYGRQDLLSGEERLRFQADGTIPDDFETRIEEAQAQASAAGNSPGAELRPRLGT